MRLIYKLILFLIWLLFAFSVHGHDYLDTTEIKELEVNALNGDVLSSNKLAYFYTFYEFDYDKKLYWNEKSVQNGSIYAMILYSYAVTYKDPSIYPDVKRYLQVLSSIGILTGKKLLLDYCKKVKKCEDSSFNYIVNLNVRDPKEYSSMMMCYVSENLHAFTKEELSVIFAIYQMNKSFYNAHFSCGKEYLSDNLKYIENEMNKKLFTNILVWLEFNKKHPNASTEDQERFIASLESTG